MIVYLIRHGKAEKSSFTKHDRDRELTSEGIQIVKTSAEFWKKYIDGFEIILVSPLKRAMQTANIISEVFKVNSKVLQETSLLNGGKTEDLLNLISSFSAEEIAMVGHQPDMGIHISKMTGCNDANIKIPPTTIAKISFISNPVIGKGILEFLIPPLIKKG